MFTKYRGVLSKYISVSAVTLVGINLCYKLFSQPLHKVEYFLVWSQPQVKFVFVHTKLEPNCPIIQASRLKRKYVVCFKEKK